MIRRESPLIQGLPESLSLENLCAKLYRRFARNFMQGSGDLARDFEDAPVVGNIAANLAVQLDGTAVDNQVISNLTVKHQAAGLNLDTSADLTGNPCITIQDQIPNMLPIKNVHKAQWLAVLFVIAVAHPGGARR